MIRYHDIKIACILLYSALICTQLTSCENENEYRYNPVPNIEGPGMVYGPAENATRKGLLNIGKDESDGYYFGEFTSGNEAYSVVLKREVLLKAGIKFDRDGRYLGTHTVVITSQHTFTVEPGHPDIYEIKSIKTP